MGLRAQSLLRLGRVVLLSVLVLSSGACQPVLSPLVEPADVTAPPPSY
jgi:hypothetical protein